MKFLFVCTGNICRSPMAEAFLQRRAAELGFEASARSSGTHAADGRPATPYARVCMKEAGVAIDSHRAALLDEEQIEWADFVVALASDHTLWIRNQHPSAVPKTISLKALVDYCETNSALPIDIAAGQDASNVENQDVDDPYGDREVAYKRVRDEIEDLVSRLAKCLNT